MKLLSRFITFIIGLIAVVFAVSNRQAISISLWPFDAAIEAPLGLIVLAALALGLLLGGVVVWLSMLPHHFMSKRLQRDLRLVQNQLEEVRASIMPTRPHHDISLLPRPKSRWKLWGHDL